MGITWCKDNGLELNTTAKEECSSPETGLPEEAETTSLGCRGISIKDFLEEDKNEKKESSVTNVSFGTEVSIHGSIIRTALFYKWSCLISAHFYVKIEIVS